MAEELQIPTNEECQKLLKYARHTALASDHICATLLAFSTRLEELNIIPKDRESKRQRDKQLKKHKVLSAPSDDKIEEMVMKLKENPDAESIVAAVLRDTSVRRVKALMTKITNAEDNKENDDEDEATD